MAKNPLIIGLASIIPQAFQVISSVIKDKKERKEAKINPDATTGEVIAESVKDAISGSISSKRVLNIVGTGAIITLAMGDISTHGLSKLNLCLIALGATYSLGMSLTTYLSERKA